MEITAGIKARVFAQYLGQKVKHTVRTRFEPDVWDERGVHECDGGTIEMCSDPDYGMLLILRPLSDITDEEMKEVVRIEMVDGFNKYWADEDNKMSTEEIGIISIERTETEITAEINCRCFEGRLSVQFLSGRIGAFDEDGDTQGVVDSLRIHQYLISIGFDLPHYLLNGSTLKEAGLCIYNQK
jgi:hypothetical protein